MDTQERITSIRMVKNEIRMSKIKFTLKKASWVRIDSQEGSKTSQVMMNVREESNTLGSYDGGSRKIQGFLRSDGF